MNIAVCVKQVPDPISVEIDPLSGAIDQSRLADILNPADAAALELALRWRDAAGGAVNIFTCGPARADQVLRDVLAAGADRAGRVWDSARAGATPAQTARALAGALRPLAPSLVVCGDHSADHGSGLVPGYLAGLLGMPHAGGVTRAEPNFAAGRLAVERRLERGRRERLELPLPALAAVDAGAAELRYAPLPAYMAAQRARIEIIAPEPTSGSNLRLAEVRPPRPRPRQIFIPDADMPALARIEAILSGGAAVRQRKKGEIVEGAPEEQAERIVSFLEQHGFLDGRY
jgi:electron transfer flavoprotein beta subunit